MKIGHLSDLHYCPKYLTEVDRCTSAALDGALKAGCEVIAITGDQTDHHLDAHAPAFLALAKRIRSVAEYAPVIVLQGTLSHDVPGTVSVFRLLGGQYPIHVSERIEQVAWDGAEWICSEGFRFETIPAGAKLLITSIPAVNRADIAARVGSQNAAAETMELVAELLAAFADINERARQAGIPTVLLSHGTVSGCITEHGVPMAGLDHEFSTGGLFGAGASAVMLGHIHRHQQWREGERAIAYAGSIGRLHYGEKGEKGWVEWEVTPTGATLEPRATPARQMQEFDYAGLPDMEQLQAAGRKAAGAFVRVRYAVDEEHRQAVDRKAIEAMFESAAELKLEGRVNPVLRSRTTGIATLNQLSAQLSAWAKATNSPEAGLASRLARLDEATPEEIVSGIVNQPQPQPQQQEAA